MFGIKDMKIGKKIIIAPAIAVLFLLILAIFSNIDKILKKFKTFLSKKTQYQLKSILYI